MRLLTASLVAIGVIGMGTSHALAVNPTAAPAARAIGWREITIPAGTALPVVLDTSVGSDISRIEQPVHGHLARPVRINGSGAIPAGSTVSGFVTAARRPGKVKGRGYVAMRFSTLSVPDDSESYRIQTRAVARMAPATKEKDALKIGVPAAGGALIGGLVGGGKGAAIGAAAGGGAGTAVVLSTRGQEVRLARGATVLVRLVQPVRVRVHEVH
jgi:hypothetical protein